MNDEMWTARDIAQLIIRLTYTEAVTLAEVIAADVDKMIDGAAVYAIPNDDGESDD